MEHFLSLQHQLPPWLLARTRRALRNMLSAAQAWIAELPADRSLAGSEVDADRACAARLLRPATGEDAAYRSP